MNVTLSDTAAVLVPAFVIVDRFAAAVALSAVIATLPAPSIVLPLTTDAAAVIVKPVLTDVLTASSRVPVNVTFSVTVIVESAVPAIVVKSTAASAVPI